MNKEFDAKIKLVGAKKSEVCAKLRDAISVFVEEETTDQLPEEVVDFFNDNLADEDVEEEVVEEKPQKKTAGKKETSKKETSKKETSKKETSKKETSKKTAGKKTAPEKAKKSDSQAGYGLVRSVVEEFYKNEISTKDMIDLMQKRFPDKSVKSTVSTVMCVLGHVKAVA
jgi:RNA polymerase primary sigma factor